MLLIPGLSSRDKTGRQAVVCADKGTAAVRTMKAAAKVRTRMDWEAVLLLLFI